MQFAEHASCDLEVPFDHFTGVDEKIVSPLYQPLVARPIGIRNSITLPLLNASIGRDRIFRIKDEPIGGRSGGRLGFQSAVAKSAVGVA